MQVHQKLKQYSYMLRPLLFLFVILFLIPSCKKEDTLIKSFGTITDIERMMANAEKAYKSVTGARVGYIQRADDNE